MKIEILADADSVARKAAAIIAAQARDAVVARGQFVVAVSGGHTQRRLRRLGKVASLDAGRNAQ